MKITVAICTWNRASLLEQTLDAMRKLRIPQPVEFEVIVVNNNCTDHTEAVIERYQGVLPLRHVRESSQGHSYARNRAVAEASGDLLIWTDDDVIVDPDWIHAYVQAAAEWPGADFFGGTVDPWFAVTPPRWIRRHAGRLNTYVITQQGPDTRDLLATDSIVGANMAFRTDVLKRYPFDVALGRVKSGLVGGDDTELLARMKRDGLKGVWVGGARVRHFIPRERLTKRYIQQWYVDAGRTHCRMHGALSGPVLFGVPRWLLRRCLVQSVKAACYSPIKDERWFESFRESSVLRGMIAEIRYARHTHAAVSSGPSSAHSL